MRQKVLLVSLRLNPAFVQHLIAYARALEVLGHEPELLLDPEYSKFEDLQAMAKIVEYPDLSSGSNWQAAIFMNPSMKNLDAARKLKAHRTRICYIFHEPWQLSVDYIRNEGLRSAVVAALAHRFTVPVLRIADHVLLPSRFALDTYRASDSKYNDQATFLPLLYDDDMREDLQSLASQKIYFSYIGKPCRAHGFDQFLAVVRHAIRLNLNIQFLIASRQPLPDSYMSDPLLRDCPRIAVRCGRLLSTEEINQCYARSICVWNVYRRSTQSGVLPKALMFGTPVICSGTGSFSEFITSGHNGQIVSGDDPKGIMQAYQGFQSEVMRYAASCRTDFLRTFYYKAHLDELASLLG